MARPPEVNRANVRALMDSQQGPAVLDMERRLIRIQNDAKRRCPVDTGRLRNSISHEIVVERGALVGRVGTNVQYATALHEGHKPIVPVTARVLRFTPKGSNVAIFRPRTRAVAGRPFLRLALPAGLT